MSEEIKIIDGTFKKDNPHQDIGKQKFRVRRSYTAYVEYDVVANSKDEAESAVSCLLYTSPSPRDGLLSRMPSSA